MDSLIIEQSVPSTMILTQFYRMDRHILEFLAFVGGKSVASTNGKVKFKVIFSPQAAIFYFAYLKNLLILSSVTFLTCLM